MKLQHIAITVMNFDQYRELFEELGMTVKRIISNTNQRQLWFCEGIQLIEGHCAEFESEMHHIAFETEDAEAAVRIALKNGCKQHPRGANWFILPNGLSVELLGEL